MTDFFLEGENTGVDLKIVRTWSAAVFHPYKERPHIRHGHVRYPQPWRRSPRAGRNAGATKDLDAEGAAATAGALDVGIIELEAGTLESFDVVDFHAIEIHGTHLVDSDLEAIEVRDFIGLVGLIFERHVILETGAAAADDGDAQGDRDGVLHTHDFLDLSGGNGRQVDHKFSWPPLAESLRESHHVFSIAQSAVGARCCAYRAIPCLRRTTENRLLLTVPPTRPHLQNTPVKAMNVRTASEGGPYNSGHAFDKRNRFP